jgi:ATP-dependent RNA helicase DeaD
MNFNELRIKEEILKVINDLGFEKPTKIQQEIIPLIIDGFDVIGQAQTGTGKTMAFALGMLTNLDYSNKFVKTLVLTPTRELAIQVSSEITKLSKYTNLKVAAVYGSASMSDQINALKNGVDIVVGTPGRVLDLIRRNCLKLNNLQFFILDEADEMLNMGFKEDLEEIFEATKKDKQVLLFSATMPKTILSMAKKYMSETYEEVSVIEDIKTAQNIKQYYYIVNEKDRVEAMCRIMDKVNPKRSMVFCKTKRNVDELYSKLLDRGFSVDIIHGDITQSQRITTLERFKKGAFNYLLATDVASRGIHVDDIELVVNYNLPQDNESYVHRIGRTGRAGKHGMAVTFVTPKEEKIMYSIEKHINTKIAIDKLPTYEEIINNKYQILIEELNNKKGDINNSKFKDHINNMNEDELKQICAFFFDKELNKKIGSDFRKDITVSSNNDKRDRQRSNNNNNSNSPRFFLTIGRMDNVEKKMLLDELEAKGNLPKGVISNVEIMTKFTFLNVDKKYADTFMRKCNRITINGRKINIERAKN